MANETKKLNKVGLSQVWAKIVANFVAKETGKGLSTNDLTNELLQKLESVAEGGEVNVIESVSVNGVALEVTNKGVNILVPTGALSELDKVGQTELEDELVALIDGKATKSTTLEGYGITDAYTKTETDAAIGQRVAGVYKVKGSVAFAELPTEGMTEGDVYNVTDDFTASEAFVEGEVGNSYQAGTNVVYTEGGWDAMAGTYDFSEFMMKSDLQDITEDEINEICVMPV